MNRPSLKFRDAQTAMRNVFALCFFVVCCLFAHVVLAQSGTATLSGDVVDQNGAVVPGAAVKIVNTATAFSRQTTTSDAGAYVFPLLPPGAYNVTVQRDGFSPVRVEHVVLNVGDQKALQIQLKAGDVNAQVTIDSDAETVRTDGSVGTVVNRQFVANIPLNGRSFNTLLELTPGVVLVTPNNADTGQFSVNGQRSNANYFMVDGVGANVGVTSGLAPSLRQTAGGSLPPVSALGGTTSLVAIDAMQEFKVLTSSFAPEYGHSPGAQVLIATRSGNNQFHGAAFEYFRNEALDANDWFANSRGLSRPAARQNDFGGTFSGPILLPRFGEGGGQPGYNGRDKTFFFFSYEGLRLRQPRTRITLVPSIAARQSPTLTPALKALLNAFPVPNGRVFADNTAEFASNISQPATLNSTSIRVDHMVRASVQVFARYNDAPSQFYQQGAADVFAMSTHSTTSLNTRTLTAGITIASNPKVISDLRFNWSRVRGATLLENDNFGGAVVPPDSLFFPYSSRSEALVGVGIGSIPIYEFGKSADNAQRQINLVGNIAIAASSSHQLKFGVDYRRLRPTNGYRKYDFIVAFGSLSGLLTSGSPSFVRFITTDAANLKVQLYNLSLYGQDTWRISPRLTLTYGTRWDYDPPPTESTKGLYGLTSVENLSTATLTSAGTPLWKAEKRDFAPRIGVAYQISRQQGKELVMRAGAGMFYDLSNPAAAGGLTSFPYRLLQFIPNPPFPLTAATVPPNPISTNPPFGSVDGLSDPNLKLPVTYEWNVAFEQSLGNNQTFSASYVGAAGRKQYITKTFQNPNPNFTTLSFFANGGTSDYHAMQLQFQRRLSQGLQALASYTWSHCIDLGSNDSFALNGFTSQNAKLERGNCDFDIRQSFSAGVTYRIPAPHLGNQWKSLFKDWWFDSMFRARSGAPVDIGYSRTILPFGNLRLRPDVVSGQSFYISDSAVPGGRRFNRAAFVIPSAARQGTLPRNTLRGFPAWQFDMALRREIRLTEKINLQLRAEGFNLLNHPNFGGLITDLNSANFGIATAMFNQSLGGTSTEGSFNPRYQIGGPRSFQFALRLEF
ncbi:MAG TPA: TonB-dependent receptor [Pyrinomonadaceae bacterium]|jgi:hypothetical protein